MAASDLEAEFSTLWRMLCGFDRLPTKEHRFHPDTKKWRFDFAWEDVKVAVEIEGGIWTNGRHTRGKGFIEDCDKYNAAAELGWAVFRFTEKHLRSSPAQCCEQVLRAIQQRSLRDGACQKA